MGLFSSTEKVTVATAAFNLMEEAPNSAAESVLLAILTGGSIPDRLMADATQGMSLQVKQAFKYAYEKYTLGLPNGTMTSVVQAPVNAVKNIIEDELKKPIAIIYSFIGALTCEMAVIDYLRLNRGYKFSSNTITVHPFVPTRRNNEPLKLYQAEYFPSLNEIRITYSHEYSTYNLVSDSKVAYEYFYENVPMPPNLYIGDTYCVAAYTILGQNGAPLPGEYYWYYRLSTNVYPQITPPKFGYGNNAYFPIVPIRRENVDLTSEEHKETELYITSKELLKKMSIDIDDIASKLNENPSIGDIDHAYIMFAVDLATQRQESLHYLCEYFDYLADVSVFTQEEFNTTLIGGQVVRNKTQLSGIWSKLIASDSLRLVEHGLDISYEYNYITSELVTGSIGPVGFADSKITPDTAFAPMLPGRTQVDNSTIRFRLQVAPLTYKEVIVCGLEYINNVYKDHKVHRYLRYVRAVREPGDEDSGFIIPIHYGVINNMPLMKRNKVYYNSYKLVVNSYQITKVKWYQKTFFKVIFIVVALVIAAYSGQAWLIKVAAIGAAGGVIAVLMYVLPQLLLAIAIGYAAKYLVKALGMENSLIIGMLITAIAIAYGQYSPGTGFNVMGSTLPTAQTMLSVGSSLMSAANTQITSDIMDVEKEMALFESDSEKQWDALEEASKILDSNSGINPIEMVSPLRSYKAFPAESPDAFYNRTIHTGNIGVLVLDVIENYAGIMLKLPEVKYVN